MQQLSLDKVFLVELGRIELPSNATFIFESSDVLPTTIFLGLEVDRLPQGNTLCFGSVHLAQPTLGLLYTGISFNQGYRYSSRFTADTYY